MTGSGDLVGYEVAMRSPLVVLAVAGEPQQLEELSNRLALDFPGERFIGIVSADQDDDVAATLTILRAVLEEVIFTDSSGPHGILGNDLATRALEEIGIGQDFVFTIEELSDAIRYAINVLTHERRDRWEGTAILVLGTPTVIGEARRAISVSGDRARS